MKVDHLKGRGPKKRKGGRRTKSLPNQQSDGTELGLHVAKDESSSKSHVRSRTSDIGGATGSIGFMKKMTEHSTGELSAKRKVGRPTKVDKSSENPEEVSAKDGERTLQVPVEYEKRRVGRTRKVDRTTQNRNELSNENVEQTSEFVVEPRKRSSDRQGKVVNHVEPSEEVITKGKGDKIVEVPVVRGKRPVGRPKKVVKSSKNFGEPHVHNGEKTIEVPTGPIKRRVGRPRKSDTGPQPSSDEKLLCGRGVKRKRMSERSTSKRLRVDESAGEEEEEEDESLSVLRSKLQDNDDNDDGGDHNDGGGLKTDDVEEIKVDRRRKKWRNKVPPPEVDLCCFHCQQKHETLPALKLHMMRAHYRIWSASNVQGDINYKRMFRLLGKLNCRDCGKEFRFASYLTYHMKWCGREDEMAACEQCGRVVKAMNLKQHVATAHRVVAEVPQQSGADEEVTASEVTATGRVRRRAASAAAKQLHDWSMTDGASEKPARDLGKHRYTCIVEVPTDVISEQKQMMADTGKITCMFQGCAFSTSTLADARQHYVKCKLRPASSGRVFKCRKCDCHFDSRSAVKSHVSKHSWREDDDDEDEFKLSADGEDEEEEDEEDYDDDCMEAVNAVPAHTGRDSLEPTRRMYVPAFKMTLDWRKRHKRDGERFLGVGWQAMAEKWSRLSDSESALYLPEAHISPRFRVMAGRRKVTLSTTRLETFDSTNCHGEATLNIGGPVWSMAWCPVPLHRVAADQYLAVYGHRSFDRLTTVTDTGLNGPCLLQLWNLGPLSSSSLHDKPSMCVSVAVDCGAIWDMKWCPSNAYDSPDMETQDGALPRLGLLALALGRGDIVILSIPHPSALRSADSKDQHPVYRVKPCVTLLPTFELCDGHAADSQCMCLDWCQVDGHRKIAAGFADGSIALWDLMTKSSILRTSTCDGIILRPYNVFSAHNSAVTSLLFSKQCADFMFSCGYDRAAKCWDLTQCYMPVHSLVTTPMTSLACSLHCPIAFAGGDNCYMFEHNCTQSVENGQFEEMFRPLTIHNCTIWDVDHSDWLNTFVSCGSAGDVMALYLPDMYAGCRSMKLFPRRRFMILTSELEKISADGGLEKVSSTNDDLDNVSLANDGLEKVFSTNDGLEKVSSTDDGLEKVSSTDDGLEKVSSTDDISDESLPSSFTSSQTNDNMMQKQTKKMEKGDNNAENNDGTTTTTTVDGHRASSPEQYCIVFKDHSVSNLRQSTDMQVLTQCRSQPADDYRSPNLRSLHKVCWNPNLGCHRWLAAAGQAGLVRLRHVTCLNHATADDIVSKFSTN